MPLEIGTNLAHYEIVQPIGKGGMGEVYRAKDSKLGRDVAIKVLPDEFAKNEERLARFRREAKVLASLNHPSIASIYGLEESNGVRFLVLELVAGNTLADRIAQSPVPVDEALGLFQQIAEGISCAHDQGVIHRDLKPANIMLTPAGKVKILDFGLAKALSTTVADANLSESPTFTRDATEAGILLGTAPYMSPEQARGRAVDKRSDIWSFGCCLFEALTGKRAFAGATVSDTIARVIERDPPWESLPASTPSGLRRLLERCLEKKSERRLRDVGDAQLELEDCAEPTARYPTAPLKANAAPWRRALPWVLAGVIGLVSYEVGSRAPSRGDRPLIRTSIDLNLPPSHPELFLNAPVAISPDGTRIVYVASEFDGVRQLVTKRLDEDEPTLIDGTAGATNPFFSPDGKWIGFFAERQLKKIALGGVGAITLCGIAGMGRGGTWDFDDTIFFAPGNTGLMKIPANGGVPESVTTLEEATGERSHRWPQILPGGDTILFIVYDDEGIYDAAKVVAQSLTSGERRVLTRATYARYAPTGHLMFSRQSTLHIMPFDPARMEVQGIGVPVQTGVFGATRLKSGSAQFSLSENGTLVYLATSALPNRQLVLVDLDGNVEPLPAPPLPYEGARFSPDGKRISFVTEEGMLYTYDLEQDRESLVTSAFEDSAGTRWTPLAVAEWNPEGSRLAFAATGGASGSWPFVVHLNRAATPTPTTPPESTTQAFPLSWLPDGGGLLYWISGPTLGDIMELRFDGTVAPRAVVATPGPESQANLSPDGDWVAYRSELSGRVEVFATPLRGAERQQISVDGGKAPVWSPDGRRTYYRKDDKMMVVDVSTEPTFSAARPRILFTGDFFAVEPYLPRSYDLSPDGQHFVMIRSQGATSPTQFRIVQNWFQELERLAPSPY